MTTAEQPMREGDTFTIAGLDHAYRITATHRQVEGSRKRRRATEAETRSATKRRRV